jgi:hypothetical protein
MSKTSTVNLVNQFQAFWDTGTGTPMRSVPVPVFGQPDRAFAEMEKEPGTAGDGSFVDFARF